MRVIRGRVRRSQNQDLLLRLDDRPNGDFERTRFADFSLASPRGYLEEMAEKRADDSPTSGGPSPAILETFENPHPQRDYVIETICPEFTSLCPKTGQPDFGTLTISYVPDRLCFELKSLKLYLQQYRNHGAFYEDVTNRILDDLVAVVRPRRMTLLAAFTPRGGITTNVTAKYESSR